MDTLATVAILGLVVWNVVLAWRQRAPAPDSPVLRRPPATAKEAAAVARLEATLRFLVHPERLASVDCGDLSEAELQKLIAGLAATFRSGILAVGELFVDCPKHGLADRTRAFTLAGSCAACDGADLQKAALLPFTRKRDSDLTRLDRFDRP